ncbi:glycosyltransferase involved in cell wall biosynthesis [Aequitasia blattaphilus]|uniref:Glycosyltransferase family 4 protein n=1 Tax=Aequitasia blattaphilus TaxID=2949332 RepID=A0ABT1E6H0_9FIRM|nr:glycosyltransferase family 4 protein [Aequitasia blattaphilus]MCP1101306.1 glycosyltransferase family 4 protein [Aequitasia blattaphilus]MCR8613946.1 glycosyltransferase family 4 protein [Aequitasia blattaphilus]
MRILSVSGQKPFATGSGIYLHEIVKSFAKKGYVQGVVAGVDQEDCISLPEEVDFYPVHFNSKELPFPTVGMSDEMPYESTRFKDLTEEMIIQYEEAFRKVIRKAVWEVKPDIILCHHLYFLTALVRKEFPEAVVYGICHNTDLRQMEKTDLKRGFIRSQIQRLNKIFTPGEAQIGMIQDIYLASREKIQVIGTGYNREIFCLQQKKRTDSEIRLIFVGKIAIKKGALDLIQSLSHLSFPKNELVLSMVGGAGNQKEYQQIVEAAKNAPYKVEFLGKQNQRDLAELYNESDLFVLPSYSEGIPLVLIEALACGLKVVITDLPGIKEWIRRRLPEANIQFVPLPGMKYADEPVAEELRSFQRGIAQGIEAGISGDNNYKLDVSALSWDGVSERIIRGNE